MADYILTFAQYLAETRPFAGGDNVTILDTSSVLEALTAVQIAQLVTDNVDTIDSSDDVLSWSVAQWDAALPGLSFDGDDFLILSDTGANIGAASAALIGQIAAAGATLLGPTDGAVSLSLAQFNALGGMSIDADAQAALTDTGANLETLTVGQIGALEVKGVDTIDASDDAWRLSVAKYQALGAVTLDGEDTVTLRDSASNITALSIAEMNALSGDGIDVVSTDDALTLSAAQYGALSALAFAGTGARNIFDTGAHIAGLDFAALNADSFDSLDAIDASNNALQLEAGQIDALGEVDLTAGDVVTLADTAAVLEGLTGSQLTAYGAKGVDLIVAAEDGANINVNQIQALLASDLDLSTASEFILADTGLNIASLSTVDFGGLQAEGISSIDATDNALSLKVADFQALGEVTLTSADTVTLADAGANLAALTVSEISALADAAIDALDATDDGLSLTLAQYNALGAVSLTGADNVTITGLGATLAGLTAGQLSGLNGVDKLDATDNLLSINVAQYNALGAVTLASDDLVTLTDTGAALSALNATVLSGLAGDNIDVIDASSGSLVWDLGELAALGSVSLTAGDTVIAEDTQANLEGLSSGGIEDLSEQGVDRLDSTDNALNFTVARARAVLENAITLISEDAVTVVDSGENIGGMTAAEIAALAGENFDAINASDDALSLTKAQYLALGALQLTGADVNTLADTGANIASLTASQFSLLDNNRIDFLDASNNILDLTVEQYGELGTTDLTAGDLVTLKDTGAALGGLDSSAYSLMGGNGVDVLDATDNVLSLNIVNALLAASGGVTLAAEDVVTVLDTAANIQALTGGQITMLSGMGVDFLDSSTTGYSLTVAQASAMGSGGIKAVAADSVGILDSGANIAAMTSSMIAGLGPDNIDSIDSNTDLLNLRTDQYVQLGTVALTQADDITLADTGASLAALTDVQIGGLAAKGIDKINSTNNSLALTVAQYRALGAVTLTGADVVTLRDTGANLGTLTNAEIAALAGNKIDAIDATDNALSISIAQFNALGSVQLASGDVVTLRDTSANIQALTAAQLISLGGKGVDRIDASDNVLSLSVAKYLNLGSVTLAGNDVVTLADSSANIEGLSLGQIGALHGNGVDRIDTTDNVLSLTVAKALALNGVTIAAGDAVTVADSAANLEALSAADFADLSTAGVDVLDASGLDTVILTAADAAALGSLSLSPEDTWVLTDTGANIAALTAAQIGELAGKGVDSINASDNVLNLSVAQYRALGELTLYVNDMVTVRDTGTNLASLTQLELAALAGDSVDKLDATNDILTLTAGQLAALDNGMVLTEADFVTVVGAGDDIAALGPDDFGGTYDDSIGYVSFVDRINASDNVLDITLEQADFFALENVALTQADLVSVAGSQVALEALTAGQFAAYANQGVDVFSSNSDNLDLNASQTSAIVNSGLLLDSENDVTVVDTSANIMASLGALLDELDGAGFDSIDTTDNLLNLTVAQALGLSVDVAINDVFSVVDTSAKIEAMTAVQFGALAAGGVDLIDATDDDLDLRVDQYLAAAGESEMSGASLLDTPPSGSVRYTAADDVTLLDTGANIAAMSVAEMSLLAGDRVDAIDATDNILNLTSDQVRELLDMTQTERVDPLFIAPQIVALTGADFITMRASGGALDDFSVAELNQVFAAGVDTFDLTSASVTLTHGQYQTLRAHGSFDTNETVTVNGAAGANLITGGREFNVLNGAGGADTLSGGGGRDVLVGGRGADRLTGGTGADTFKYSDKADSNLAYGVDRIGDLDGELDVIDIGDIDANSRSAGDQAFTLVASFTNRAGELMASYNSESGITTFSGDVNGDGVADLIIEAQGDHEDFSNFVL